MCRALQNTNLHTFLDMLGYCMEDAKAPHYYSVEHNVFATNLAVRVELYAQYGLEDKNNRVGLNLKNTLERGTMCRQLHVCNKSNTNFKKTLYLMIMSGKYYLAISWVVGAKGGALDKS